MNRIANVQRTRFRQGLVQRPLRALSRADNFFRFHDSNHDGGLDANDALLGFGTLNQGVWSFTFSTPGWASRTHRLFAQAQDSTGLFGDPVALDLEVV